MNISSIFLAALLSSSPRVHHLEGSYPMARIAPGATTASLEIAYPTVDGGRVDRYAGTYTVRVDAALRAVLSPGGAGGRIRLERADGERVWHVVGVVTDSPAW